MSATLAPKIKTLKQAREAALAGHVDAALPVFEAEAARGKASGWAALSQIRAYRGDWDGALDAVTRLLADPSAAPSGSTKPPPDAQLLAFAALGRERPSCFDIKTSRHHSVLMQTRISLDLGSASLVRLIKQEAHATDSSMKAVVVRALEAYLSHRLETKALMKAAEGIFEEWNDPRDADYDRL